MGQVWTKYLWITLLGILFFPLITKANTEATNKAILYENIPAGTGIPDNSEWDQLCQCTIWVQGTGYKTCASWECNQQVEKKVTINPSNELLDYLNFNAQLFIIAIGIIMALLIMIIIILKL